jgi:hypothetical protein
MKPLLLLLVVIAAPFCVFAFENVPDFSEPPPGYQLKNNYRHIDRQNLVKEAPLIKALKFFEYNKAKIENHGYITLIDFSQHSSKKRLYQIGMDSGSVTTMLVSAGQGSDPDHDGNATEFSNENGSHMSSLGFYMTGNEYEGEHGKSLQLHGLSSTNSNAFDRAIVIHGADYVPNGRGWAGRSHGCPAVERSLVGPLIDRLKDGSLLYIFD